MGTDALDVCTDLAKRIGNNPAFSVTCMLMLLRGDEFCDMPTFFALGYCLRSYSVLLMIKSLLRGSAEIKHNSIKSATFNLVWYLSNLN